MADPKTTAKAAHPRYAAPAIKSDTDQQVWLGNPHVDNLTTMVIALSSEVWANRQRTAILEKVLAAKGIDVAALVESYVPTKEEFATWEAQRQAAS